MGKRILIFNSFRKRIALCCVSGYIERKFLGTGSGNLSELEEVINRMAKKGYRLHTVSTAHTDSKGFGGGDRIQATLVFERVDIEKILQKWSEEYAKGINTEQYLKELDTKKEIEKLPDSSNGIDPSWKMDGSFWVICPNCGQKSPLSYIQSNGKCPSCGYNA